MNKNPQIVNLTYLKDMSGDNKEIMKEMINIFISQVSEFAEEMEDLNNKKEYFKLGNLAHKAKSSISIMGMENLANELKEFELLAKEEKDTDNYKEFINHFKQLCDLATDELKEINK
ncbi:MAG: Hpt domain-containing protein [Bacteroidales bacterium]|nr:Hpt domain-containing protein [Bacteroidales bacterium]